MILFWIKKNISYRMKNKLIAQGCSRYMSIGNPTSMAVRIRKETEIGVGVNTIWRLNISFSSKSAHEGQIVEVVPSFFPINFCSGNFKLQIRLHKPLPLTTLFDFPSSPCKRLPRSFCPSAFLPDAALFSALTWFAKHLVSGEFIPKVGREPVVGGGGEGKDGG